MEKIENYWRNFCEAKNIAITTPYEAFSFGNTPAMADELSQLVLTGKKTGTSSGFALYGLTDEALPQEKEYSIVLDGSQEPICVIFTKKVEILAFKDVTSEHAVKEGEGDLSLAYWQKEHIRFLTPYYKEQGLVFDENSLLVFEEFEVVR